MPLKGYHKYGYVSLNQAGSKGETLVKYGSIDFWATESTINKQSRIHSLLKWEYNIQIRILSRVQTTNFTAKTKESNHDFNYLT